MNRYNSLPSYHYEQETLEGGAGQINPASPEMRKLSIYGAVHKNLIKYPYLSNGDTINGVTFTVQEDGAIFVQGTATADTVFTFQSTNVKAGVSYVLSGCPSDGSSTKFYLRDQDHNIDTGSGKTFTPSADNVLDISVVIISGTAMNHYFYPQLEKGTARTPYAKYTKQLLGQKTPNIFYWPFEDKTEKGITYEINKNNPCEIHIYGTATEAIYDTIAIENIEANTEYIVATNKTAYNVGFKCNDVDVRTVTPQRFKTNSLPLSPLRLQIAAGATIDVTFKVCIVTLESIEWDFYKRNITQTNGGITFTYNNDASITLNGTVNVDRTTVYQNLFINDLVYFDKEYPAVEKHSRIQCAMLCSSVDNLNEIDYITNNLNVTVTHNARINGGVKFDSSTTASQLQTYFEIPSGTTFDNLTVYPHFYYMPGGDYLYDYGYETLIQTVTEETKDIDIYPYADTTKTVNGITFTDNGDGSITMNGTATDRAEFQLKEWALDKLDLPYQYNIYTQSNKTNPGAYIYLQTFTTAGVMNRQTYTLRAKATPLYAASILTSTAKNKMFIVILQGAVLDNLTITPKVVKKWCPNKHQELKLSQKQLSVEDVINDENVCNLFSDKVNNIVVCSNYNNLARLNDNYKYTLHNSNIEYNSFTNEYQVKSNEIIEGGTSRELFTKNIITPINSISGNMIMFRYVPVSNNVDDSIVTYAKSQILWYKTLYQFKDKMLGANSIGWGALKSINKNFSFLMDNPSVKETAASSYLRSLVLLYTNAPGELDFKFKIYVTPLVKGVYSNVYGMDNPSIASSEVIVEYYKH